MTPFIEETKAMRNFEPGYHIELNAANDQFEVEFWWKEGNQLKKVDIVWKFEPDGDVTDDGRGIDCSYWHPSIQESALNAQSFFASVFSKIDLSDIRPQYMGASELDYEDTKEEIKTRIEDALNG